MTTQMLVVFPPDNPLINFFRSWASENILRDEITQERVFPGRTKGSEKIFVRDIELPLHLPAIRVSEEVEDEYSGGRNSDQVVLGSPPRSSPGPWVKDDVVVVAKTGLRIELSIAVHRIHPDIDPS